MVSPRAATKALNLKKLTPKPAAKKPLAIKAANGQALKAKMKALLAANQKKLLAQKAQRKPVTLAQTSSSQEVEQFAKALT